MDLLTYLSSLIRIKPVKTYIKPTKLIAKETPPTRHAKDNTIVSTYKPDIIVNESTINKEGLLEAFPKEMNWLNWENKGFQNALLDAQIWTESRGNPNAISPAGAGGIAQFMPITWKEAKRNKWIEETAKRTNIQSSLKAQKALMNNLYNRDLVKEAKTTEDRYARTLASYNAGYGSLSKAIKKAKQSGGYWLDYMPSETRKYVPEIMTKTEEDYFKNKENYISKYDRD